VNSQRVAPKSKPENEIHKSITGIWQRSRWYLPGAWTLVCPHTLENGEKWVLSGVRQVDWKAIRLPLPCIKYEATGAITQFAATCIPFPSPESWQHHQIEIGIRIKIKCLSAIWFSSKAHQTHYVAFMPDHFGHVSIFFEPPSLFIFWQTNPQTWSVCDRGFSTQRQLDSNQQKNEEKSWWLWLIMMRPL